MGQMKQIGISPEHFNDIQGINKYLQEHRINQLFNVSIDDNYGAPKIQKIVAHSKCLANGDQCVCRN